MLTTDKSPIDTPVLPAAHADGISIGTLLTQLAAHGDLPLNFAFEGGEIRSGFHVTEVKAADFSALDCGANPESWSEIFIQLLDVDGEGPHMPARKFSAIIRKVTEHVKLGMEARLTFEVSDGAEPMRLFKAGPPEVGPSRIVVPLTARAASCKPRDRWLAEERATASSCCVSAASSSQACCA